MHQDEAITDLLEGTGRRYSFCLLHPQNRSRGTRNRSSSKRKRADGDPSSEAHEDEAAPFVRKHENNTESPYLPKRKETVGLLRVEGGRWQIERMLGGVRLRPDPAFPFPEPAEPLEDPKEEAAVRHDLFLLMGAWQDPPVSKQTARDMVCDVV